MATVTALLDSICADIGLDTSGTDRTVALSRLNQAYDQLCQQAVRVHKQVDYTPVSGLTEIDVTTVPTMSTDFLALDNVRILYTDGTVSKPIDRASRAYVADNRSTTQGITGSYAYAWPTIYLDKPTDGLNGFRFQYVGGPVTLSESSGTGVETTPTSIPPGWHYRLLAGLAKVLLLEGYEGREDTAVYHRNLFNEALAEFRMHQHREGGENMALDPHSIRAFDTPNPSKLR